MDYFEFFSVSMQDLFETWNYFDRYDLNLHRDEVLQPEVNNEELLSMIKT